MMLHVYIVSQTSGSHQLLLGHGKKNVSRNLGQNFF